MRPVTKKPKKIIKEWAAVVNARDIESLLALYNEKAVLIPTFSNRLLSDPKQIREYFEKLAGREELNVALHEKTLLVRPIKDAVCAVSGIYCWRFVLDAELLNFEARFGFVLDTEQSGPIMHHHSSQIPRML